MPSRCAIPFDIAVDSAFARLGERHELEQPRALGGAAARAGEPLVQLQHLIGPCTSRGSERARRGSRGSRGPPAAGARAHDLGVAAGGADEPGGDLHERRLARPVRPEEADELALPDDEVDPAQRLDRP